MSTTRGIRRWLMKAEPDSRTVKGKDVKFSVDDFETVRTTAWEGVRNAEARNLMKEMAVGDQVLFYHSNCKNPGVAAFAEVSKEAYPDYTAWDPAHPYYDPKTDEANPKWYMVDVTFKARTEHFIPLSLLKQIASNQPDSEPPSDVAYIGKDGISAIKEMALVSRGRLSVQRVEEATWAVIEKLAKGGGWDESGKAGKVGKPKPPKPAAEQAKNGEEDVETSSGVNSKGSTVKKRKVTAEDNEESKSLRRSTRARK